MVTDWKTCLNLREAKQVQPDEELAKSLQKTSANKAFSSANLKLMKETATSKISLSYDAVREFLEAIALLKGYKIYNHVCYTSFLKEILNESEKAEEFDELRKIRNDINYYGKEVTINEAEKIIKRLESLRNEFLRMI